MDSITLENFRCFREKQTVRLAPLTLLVGENSTGKTSFLALIRALWDMAYDSRTPDFREQPWDLGSFDEIAHHRGARGSRADSFNIGYGTNANGDAATRYSFTLGKDGTVPVQTERRVENGEYWMRESLPPTVPYALRIGTRTDEWKPAVDGPDLGLSKSGRLNPPSWILYQLALFREATGFTGLVPVGDSSQIGDSQLEGILNLSTEVMRHPNGRPFASAPVRSKPVRTYDPARINFDPEGHYVPMYLADIHSRYPDVWASMRHQLEDFGKPAGLFDEIRVNQLNGGAFQIQVRKHGGRSRGPWRNLVDVGYGVSQALPIVCELNRPDAPELFLLQQPEVHLHPMAQAALGTLFCRVAGAEAPRRQIVVETHSEHLIDRVRMDVRDKVTGLTPDDVVVLYFEREGLDVRIHEVTFDALGNVSAPPNYGKFFTDEVHRSLWPEDYAPNR